ncbi:hypothetical protein B0J12DRAFT_168283 [Macrophomina phaseolina]|uniref:Secreted protein n=1 Tax=Macrophomina phaseolina TaxID=35725 RepID=A0ABQ8GV28_9PEZI|nr:hypothetical protein B0J12DRAFT_168283 [Macrophomina phaseolina]
MTRRFPRVWGSVFFIVVLMQPGKALDGWTFWKPGARPCDSVLHRCGNWAVRCRRENVGSLVPPTGAAREGSSSWWMCAFPGKLIPQEGGSLILQLLRRTGARHFPSRKDGELWLSRRLVRGWRSLRRQVPVYRTLCGWTGLAGRADPGTAATGRPRERQLRS